MVKAGEILDREALTVNERVLLHLRESGGGHDLPDAYPLTQPGIAEAVGIRVNHVSRAVKQLIREGLVHEESARVRGEVRKRKTYDVTPEGHASAQRLIDDIAGRQVVAVHGRRKNPMPATEARRLLSPPTFTRLISSVDGEGRLDVRPRKKGAARARATFAEGRPAPVEVLGRKPESDTLANWLETGPPVLAIMGPRGIGKTAFASASIPDDRPTFWWSFREGDTAASWLAGLASWLADLGKGDLRQRLPSGPPTWREIARTVSRDLRGSEALLILDDLHLAGEDLTAYVDAVLEAATAIGCRVLVTTEEALPDRELRKVQGLLQELPMDGLDRAAARKILPRKLAKEEFEKVFRLTNGNPLSLKLLAAEEAPSGYTAEERALLKVLRLRQDEG